MERFGFILDLDLCINCGACQVACKEAHRLDAGVFFRRVDLISTASGVRPLSLSCIHCETCAAAEQCPAEVFSKAPDGSVQLSRERCIGCGLCAENCPYGAIALLKDEKAAKCDACYQRRMDGKEPFCVSACRTGALQLLSPPKRQNETAFLSPLPGKPQTCPSILLRSKADCINANTKLFYVNQQRNLTSGKEGE